MPAPAAFTPAPGALATPPARLAAVARRRPLPAPSAAGAAAAASPARCSPRMMSSTPPPKPVTDVEDDGGDGFFGTSDMTEALGVSVELTGADREYLDAAVDEADLIDRLKVLARAFEEKRTAPRKGKGMANAGDYLSSL